MLVLGQKIAPIQSRREKDNGHLVPGKKPIGEELWRYLVLCTFCQGPT
jgi:hypothetical protein